MLGVLLQPIAVTSSLETEEDTKGNPSASLNVSVNVVGRGFWYFWKNLRCRGGFYFFWQNLGYHGFLQS